MVRKSKKKTSKWKLILLAVLSTILAVAIGALLLVKVFVVKDVKVEGNVLYDENLIKTTVLNDEYSWNSLYVLLKYTFTDTKQIPFIDTMEITMEDPQTLKIKVYEKGLLGYLYIPAIGQNAYFDKDGIVVETSTRIIENVPRMEGLECNTVVLYEKLPIDDKLLKQLLTLTQSLKRDGLEPDAIQYGVKNAPVLKYENVDVNLGSIEYLTQKVERIKKILPELEGMAGTLHLENWDEQTTNIVFEKAE
ncbi:MAG: cell division protein FtsQ [Agathobacter sp.]